MQFTGPFSVAAIGTFPATFDDPDARDVAVQVQNGSGYYLSMIIGGQLVAIPPQSSLTASTPSAGANPVILTSAISMTVLPSNTVTFVWLRPGETSPTPDGPLLAEGSATIDTGTGADGTVTLLANAILARDMDYVDLNLGGFVLTGAGYVIRATGTVAGPGKIANNGGNNNSSTATPVAGGVGAPGATLGGGIAGASYASGGAAVSAAAQPAANVMGGGGAINGGDGANTTRNGTPPVAITNSEMMGLSYVGGGGGATGNAADLVNYTANKYASGGGGAGCVMVMCREILSNVTIEVIGGNTSVTGLASFVTGIPGPGGGGVAVVAANSIPSGLSVNVSGGSYPYGAGLNGQNGSYYAITP